MTQEPNHDPGPEPQPNAPSRTHILVQRTILVGRICVLLSGVFLYLSKLADTGHSGNFGWAMLLMAARTCGIASFAIGGVAIYNGRWTEGVLMMLLSVVLPVVAFVAFGTI